MEPQDSLPRMTAPLESVPAMTAAPPDSETTDTDSVMSAAPPDSVMTAALPAAETTAAPPDSETTAAPPDSAPAMTAAPPDAVPAMTETELKNLATFESTLESDAAPTKEDDVASRLPFGAAEEPAKKKAKTDFGFGAQRWGNRLGGNPNWTMDNTYIHAKDLEGRQREALFMSYQHITRVHGSTLPPKELYMRVANLFNIWHIGLVEKDGYGYGGKIGEKVVEQCFKKEGRSILQGSLGGHVIPQAAGYGRFGMQIPQPVPLEGGPMQPVFYQRRVACSAKPSLTGLEIEVLSQRNARARLKELGLSQHGTVAELKVRLKKHYRV
jgi:hypothetical protein